MARKSSNHGCGYWLFGGWIIDIIKWIIIIAFWPISLVVYLLKKSSVNLPNEKYHKSQRSFDDEMNRKLRQFRDEQEERLREHYTNQLNESLTLINETNNIATLFSRLSFLDKLRHNVISYGEGDLSDVIDNINGHIALKEEYVNLFILRQLSAIDASTETSIPAAIKRKYKNLYQRFDPYKGKMSETNISLYTKMCQQRLDIDHLSLPQYSALLTRLNNAPLNAVIPEEYFEGMFIRSSEAVQFLKQKGLLTVSDDNTKYALTELGKKETGWL